MKLFPLGSSNIMVSNIAAGGMRYASLNLAQMQKLMQVEIDNGINFFDFADVYGGGQSERIFGQALKQSSIKREDLIIQSKVGLTDFGYDFSKEHILNSVDGILRRLQTDYLDVLLLHRPDPLMEPAEISSAFNQLRQSGKVREFRVSNMNTFQIEFLQSALNRPLLVDQVQFSLMHTGMIDFGIHTNMKDSLSIDHDGGLLPYSQKNKITLQAWSPLQYEGPVNGGFINGQWQFHGLITDNPEIPQVNKVLDQIAKIHGVSKTAIATAWILRHPAHIQMIAGTTNPQHLSDILEANEVQLSRQEWYALYLAGGHTLP
ncbi:aldo/keto reductase [Loigolactobacillus backii]|uniref:aldo/keto reductase n=1 Tax=Loigolactobacillus backii TaxID=375175 RepID=UPI0007F0A78D|nr:aldo/keto reductase [Loigolactobacillus backii]ANK60574.1 aldo/keto reductase [Loigolactobacillus backii]